MLPIVHSDYLAQRHALSLSPFAPTSDGVVIAAPPPGAAMSPTIAPPAYRTPLPPRPGFQLVRWRRKRDMGGDRRAADTEAYDPSGNTLTVLSSNNADLTTQQWLRYGGLLIMPTRAIQSRQLYALLLYFLLLLPLVAGLFALSALVACSTSAELVVPLCASWIAASGVVMFVLYRGGCGPFDCGLREESAAPGSGGQTDHVHRYLPARFSAGVGAALGIVCVQSLVCALLVSGEFGTLCQLANTISVNEAASFSTLWAQQSGVAPRADGSPTLLVNDGSAHSDSSSTRSFLAFRDGFIQTQMVRGLNVTDQSDATVVASEPAGLSPTRMLLLAPIWVSSRDPFYARVVPVWACGSFSVLHNTFEQTDSAAAIVASWSALHRFGRTTNAFDRDYKLYQDLIATLLRDSASMKQMAGAPLLYWSDPSELREAAIRHLYSFLVPSLLLTLLVWLGTGLLHARWYRSMIAEEAAWEAKAVQRRERNTVRIKAKDDEEASEEEAKGAEETSGSEHKDEQMQASSARGESGVELASVSRPFSPSASMQQQQHSSVISPSQHVHPATGSSQISRTGSLSSAASTFLPAAGGGAASRPASASVASLASPSASATGAPSSSWWKSSRLFGGRGETTKGAAISPSPVEAFAAPTTPPQQPPQQPSSSASAPVPSSAVSPVPASSPALSSRVSSPMTRQRGGLRAQMAADHAAAAQSARPGSHSSTSPAAAHVTLHMDPADSGSTLTAARPAPTSSPTASPPSTQRTPRGARAAPYPPSASRLRASAAPVPAPVSAAAAESDHQADEDDASGGSSARVPSTHDDTDLSERSDESLVRTVSMERNAGGMGLSNRSPRSRPQFGDGGAASSSASHPFSSDEPETPRVTSWAPRSSAQR